MAKKILVASAVFVVLGCVVAWAFSLYNRRNLPTLPVPKHAFEVRNHVSFLGLRKELSFKINEPHPRHSVRVFYGEWATRRDWELVAEGTESWSRDRWESFQDATVSPIQEVDQWLVHWASPGRKWSLRLALRYSRDWGSSSPKQVQEVYVVLEPFHLLGSG